MEAVLNKISNIETAAVSIMEQANARKKEMSQAMADKTAAYDRQMEESTNERLSRLKQELNAKTQAQLAHQQARSQEVLQAMEDDYRANHTLYAQRILDALIKG